MNHDQIQVHIQDALIVYYNSIGFKFTSYIDLWMHLNDTPVLCVVKDIAAALEINKIPCGCY